MKSDEQNKIHDEKRGRFSDRNEGDGATMRRDVPGDSHRSDNFEDGRSALPKDSSETPHSEGDHRQSDQRGERDPRRERSVDGGAE